MATADAGTVRLILPDDFELFLPAVGSSGEWARRDDDCERCCTQATESVCTQHAAALAETKLTELPSSLISPPQTTVLCSVFTKHWFIN